MTSRTILACIFLRCTFFNLQNVQLSWSTSKDLASMKSKHWKNNLAQLSVLPTFSLISMQEWYFYMVMYIAMRIQAILWLENNQMENHKSSFLIMGSIAAQEKILEKSFALCGTHLPHLIMMILKALRRTWVLANTIDIYHCFLHIVQ